MRSVYTLQLHKKQENFVPTKTKILHGANLSKSLQNERHLSPLTPTSTPTSVRTPPHHEFGPLGPWHNC